MQFKLDEDEVRTAFFRGRRVQKEQGSVFSNKMVFSFLTYKFFQEQDFWPK